MDDEATTMCCPQRWIVAFCGFMLCAIAEIYRADMSIAIVCMVVTKSVDVTETLSVGANDTANITEGLTEREGCVTQPLSNTTRMGQGEFHWNKDTQSYVLSAFFYGYLVSQIPGGWLANRYGGKHVISVSMGVATLLVLLTPVFARINVYILVVARIFIGLCVGVTQPAVLALVGVWTLPNERSRVVSLLWIGQNVGTVLGYFSSGLLCANGFDFGWGSIFYVHGSIGFVFVCMWLYSVFNSPETHPRISNSEKKLILSQIYTKTNAVTVPWLNIMKSIESWTIFITHTCENCMYLLIVTCLPLYFKEVLKFDIENNGLYSSLPFISASLGLVTASPLVDYVISKALISRTATRKVFQITGMVGECTFVIVASYLTCERRELVVMCLCLCTFFMTAGMGTGYTSNVVDMAPRYASVLYGISNCFASLPGLIFPPLVASLTPNGTQEEWRTIFFLVVGLVLFAAVIFGVFSTSELVSWADESAEQNKKEDNTLESNIKGGEITLEETKL